LGCYFCSAIKLNLLWMSLWADVMGLTILLASSVELKGTCSN
jgi:hypothetical protein